MENFRPGVLDRLGFSQQRMAELNPRLVVLSISGFGHDGPEAGRAGYDQIAQGEAGLMSVTGSGPTDLQRVGVPIADLLAGMYGAFGVLAALQERERTGRGQVVRASLLAAVVGVHAFQGTKWTVAGQVGEAAGNHHPSICPYGLFETADGAVQIAVGSEGLWKRFCDGFGLDPDAPGMATNPERVANGKRVNEMVQAAFALYSTDELLAKLDRIGVPAGRIRSIREVYEWEQTRSQGLLIDVDHATLGTITLPGPPLRFFSADGAELTRAVGTARHRFSVPTMTSSRRRAGGATDEPARRPGRHRPAHRCRVVALLGPASDAGQAVDHEYAEELACARAKTGLDEAVITGVATIRGRRIAMLVCDFGFLGGSIGVAAGDRLTAAIRRATAEKLPLLALPTSGGTRMQEGTTAFLQMVKITTAVVAHKSAHLPYLVYLRDPTTGGVFASWGSLGHVTFAEPGALVGFLGPRVYEALYGNPFPTGVQTAENLYACGLIDAVTPLHELGDMVDRALTIIARCPHISHHAQRRSSPHRPTSRLAVGDRLPPTGPARRSRASPSRRHRCPDPQWNRPGREGPRTALGARTIR